MMHSFRRPGAHRISPLQRYRVTAEVPISPDLRRGLISGLEATRAECTLSRWESGFSADMLDRLRAGANRLTPRQFATVAEIAAKWEVRL